MRDPAGRPPVDTGPRLEARIAGALYLVTILTGFYGFRVLGLLSVHGDAAATAARIMAAEPLYRSAVAAEFISAAFYAGLTAILYGLLKPVSPTASRAAAFFSLAGCATIAASLVFLLAPLALLGGAPYLTAFSPDQRQALALISIRLFGQGYNIAIIFFGFYCSLLGYLVVGSAFLPRIIGLFLFVTGAGWLTDGFATVLAPAFESRVGAVFMASGLLGEGSLCVWLLLVGVNTSRWREQASRRTDRAP
jgi:hypothetical protein